MRVRRLACAAAAAAADTAAAAVIMVRRGSDHRGVDLRRAGPLRHVRGQGAAAEGRRMGGWVCGPEEEGDWVGQFRMYV